MLSDVSYDLPNVQCDVGYKISTILPDGFYLSSDKKKIDSVELVNRVFFPLFLLP